VKFLKKINLKLILILGLYIILVLIINPNGNFPINDDWIFYRQVEAFLSGQFRINSLIDPSFISQGIVALFWSKIFGLSFYSLRLLSILFTLVFAFFTYRSLEILKIKEYIARLVILLLLFNPIILNSSMTFMTEIYFLAFLSTSIFFFIKYFQKSNIPYLILSCIFSGFALLTRQTGIVLFISFILVILLNSIQKKKFKFLDLGINFVILLIFLVIYFTWPSVGLGISSKIISPSIFISRIGLFLYIPIYFVFFSLPLILSIKNGFVLRTRFLTILVAILISFFVYKYDIFPIGNVFYVEDLLSKTGFRTNFSLYDNVLFKVVLSFFISFAFIKLISLVYAHSMKDIGFFKRLTSVYLFLVLCFLGFLITSLLGNDFYDRYLITAFYFFIILLCIFVSSLHKLNVKKLYVITALFIFFSFSLQYEFFNVTREKWAQAFKLQEITGLKTGIKVNNEYLRLNHTDKESFTNNDNDKPVGIEYKCFIQDYAMETNSRLSMFMQSIDNFTMAYIRNPKIYDYKKENLPNIKKSISKLIINKEIKSPIYNLVGKKEFVGSWCLD